MPTLHVFPLNDEKDDLPKLNQLLNEQETKLGREVVQVDSKSHAGSAINEVTVFFNLDAKKKKRLKAVEVPQEATAAARLNAATPVPAREAKEAFLKFIAPLLENHETVYRAEVGVDRTIKEIVLLREAEPFKPVIMDGTILTGTDWPWTAQVVGEDIVVQGAKTTAFGGDNDSADNGQTASGYPTKGNPMLMGCALPLDGYAKTKREKAALDGTPLPHMPFGITKDGRDNPDGAHVEVMDPKTGRQIILPVIDLGPAKHTGHPLDLTEAAARFFKSNATANNFSMVLNYRLIKGALALKPGTTSSLANAHTEAVVNGASVKAGIVKATIEEWDTWGNSTPGDVHLVESHEDALPRIEAFWADGVGTPKPGNFKTPWSAAFISFCMRKGGAGASFAYSGRHSVYISKAINDRGKENAAFWGFRLSEYAPQVGDIICWSREAGVSYDNQKGGDYDGHCDIVVATKGGSIEAIGGNLSESVLRFSQARDGQGRLKPSGDEKKFLIAVIQNRLA
jgi:hypothetical protein